MSDSFSLLSDEHFGNFCFTVNYKTECNCDSCLSIKKKKRKSAPGYNQSFRTHAYYIKKLIKYIYLLLRSLQLD